MSNAAITVENLGKKYNLRHQVNRDEGLRHVLQRALTAPFRRRADRPAVDEGREEFWALREVNFEVQRGEVIGVIGRNGAGKSTLLKILSRITEPTTGRIEIEGRVASLLEVGTGFHPELTGRENIYLNGTILGMTRREIARKFDEIVAFAEVEKFLDTPVKHYSSGMYVRLAFAVAAHLEPDILIVDEVLAVGDAQFQKKCLGKMKDVSSREGRTVLFVSHNMGAVMQLCTRALVLQQGRTEFAGPVNKAVGHYFFSEADKTGVLDASGLSGRKGPGGARLARVRLLDGTGRPATTFFMGGEMIIEYEIETTQPIERVRLGVQISTNEGLNVANMIAADSGFALTNLGRSEKLRVHLRDLRFYPGDYLLSFFIGAAHETELHDLVEHAMAFSMVNDGRFSTRDLPRESGLFFLTPEWQRVTEDGS